MHPINDEHQQVVSHFISVTNNSLVETYDDFYGNKIGTFLITEPHDELSIISEVEVNITSRLFPDDSNDVKTQWAELKLRKYDADVIDFLKPMPFSGSEEVLNLVNCFLANGPPGSILLTASFKISSVLFFSESVEGEDTLIPPG